MSRCQEGGLQPPLLTCCPSPAAISNGSGNLSSWPAQSLVLSKALLVSCLEHPLVYVYSESRQLWAHLRLDLPSFSGEMITAKSSLSSSTPRFRVRVAEPFHQRYSFLFSLLSSGDWKYFALVTGQLYIAQFVYMQGYLRSEP